MGIPQYQTRLRKVNAVQFWPDQKPWPEGVEEYNPGHYHYYHDCYNHSISPGWWIIENACSMSNEAFAFLYKRVPDRRPLLTPAEVYGTMTIAEAEAFHRMQIRVHKEIAIGLSKLYPDVYKDIIPRRPKEFVQDEDPC